MILEQLYIGNINPSHLPEYKTETSKYYREQTQALEKELGEKLDAQGRQTLMRLLEADTAADCAKSTGDFIHGFKLATLMMAEVFLDKEKMLYDPELYWYSKMPPQGEDCSLNAEK